MSESVLTDEWFTPVSVYTDIVNFCKSLWCDEDLYTLRFLDPTSCEESFNRIAEHLVGFDVAEYWTNCFEKLKDTPSNYDFMFCNPPYSKQSGGAELFVQELKGLATHNLFLVNYGSWVSRLDKKPVIGLVGSRIAFEPSQELAKYLEEKHRKKYPNSKMKTGEQPRYDNVFIYYGPLRSDELPKKLGKYHIRWVD